MILYERRGEGEECRILCADAVLLQEPQGFQMRKCLEAVYVAKNEVVNGCTGANMGASWRAYL